MAEKDYISITGLKIYAYHGVYFEEQEKGQNFYINAKLCFDMHPAGRSDALSATLDYGECCHYIKKVFTERSFHLLEAAAEHLCRRLLLQYSVLRRVELDIYKPHAPVGLPFDNVSVHMARSWHTVYISFGSNMGDRQAQIHEGIEELGRHPDIWELEVSNIIETKPYGSVQQGDFLNGALKIETLLEPEDLLAFLQEIEGRANRERKVRWGPRTLDMDIIFYDRLVYDSRDLVIPHVDMQNREFVLEPLKQLCPFYRHPILGKTVEQLYMELKQRTQVAGGMEHGAGKSSPV